MTQKNIGVGVIWNQQEQILIDRRRLGGSFGGLWEFPGGKIEPGETVEDCIKREIWEELGIVITVGSRLISISHTYDRLQINLIVHHCQHTSGIPQPLECEEIRWVTLAEIDRFEFPAANAQIITALRHVG
jgi:8-oxo-dGTP diphosphatase